MKSKLLPLGTLSLLPFIAHAQSIPDEINFVKYQSIYEQAKKVSSELRAQAQATMEQYQQTTSLIASKKSTIIQHKDQISKNIVSIKSLNDEIPVLINTITNLSEDKKQLEQQIATAEETLSSLEKSLSAEDEKLKVEQTKLFQLNSEKDVIESTIQNISSSLAAQNKLLGELIDANRSLANEISTLSSEINTAKTDLAVLKQRQANLSNDAIALESSLNKLQKRQGNLSVKLVDAQKLEKRLKKQKKAAQQKQAGVVSEIAQKAKEKKALNKAIKDAKGYIQTAKANIAAIDVESANASSKLTSAKTKQGSLKTKVQNLTANLSTSKNRVSELESSLAPLKTSLQSVEQKIAKKGKTLASLLKNPSNQPEVKEKIKTIKAEIASLASKKQGIKKSISTLKKDIAAKKAQVKSLNEKIATKQEQLKKDKAALVSFEQNLPKLQAKLSNAKTQKAKQESRLPKIEQALSALQAELTALSNSKKEIDGKVSANKQKQSKLTKEIAKLKKAIKRLANGQGGRGNAVNRGERLKKLKAQLAKKEAALDSAKAALSKLATAQSEMATKVSAKQSEVTSKENTLKDVKSKIATAQAIITDLGPKLANSQGTIANLKLKITSTSKEISDAKSTKKSLQASIQTQSAKISPLEGQLSSIETSIASKNTQMQNIISQAANSPRIIALKGEIEKLTKRSIKLKGQISPIASKLKAEKAKEKSIQSKLATAKSELSSTKSKIASLEKKIEDLAAKKLADQKAIKKNKQSIAQNNIKLTNVQNRLNILTPQVPTLNQLVNLLKKDHAAALSEVNRLSNTLADVQGRLGKLTGEYNTVVNRLNRLAKKIPALRNFIVQSQNQIDDNYMSISQNEKSIGQVRRNLQSLEAQLGYEQSALSSKNSQIAQVNNVIAGIDQVIANLESQISGTSSDLSLLNEQDEQLATNIELKTAKVSYNRNKIEELKSDNISMTSTISQFTSDIPRLDILASDLMSKYELEDDIAKEKELITDQKFKVYITSKNLYDQRKSDALKAGQDQGDKLGAFSGSEKGEIAGIKQGNISGASFGMSMAQLSSSINGLSAGMKEGKSQGYEHGLKAPENYASGFSKGEKEGIAKAWSVAKELSYPQGRSDTKKKILSTLPSNMVNISNAVKVDFDTDVVGSVVSVPEKLAKESALEWDSGVAAQIKESSSSEQFVSAKIDALSVKLSNVEKSYELTVQGAGQGLELNIVAETDKANCARGYDLFNQLCIQSFAKAYKEVFAAEYVNAYTVNFQEKIASAKDTTLAQNANIKYQQTYDEAFKLVFDEWDEIGANEAINTGYVEGKEEGYSKTIEIAKSTEYKKGENEELAFFKNNAVLRVADAMTSPKEGSYFPGSMAIVNLKAINFGQMASQRGAIKVLVTSGSRYATVLNEGATELVGITGQTQANISDVALVQLSADAKTGAFIPLTVKAFFNNGKVVTKKTGFRVNQHVQAVSTITADKTPKVSGFFWVKKKHVVKVDIENQSRSYLDSGFSVSIIAPAGIQVLESSINSTPSLARSKSVSTSFAYKVKDKKLKGQSVKLTVVTKYEGITLDEKTITVVPR